MLSRLLKTERVRQVRDWVVMRNMVGASLFVTPNTPGTTSRSFRDVANAAVSVLARRVLRMAFVVLFLSRTLIMEGMAFYRPPSPIVV